MYRHGHYGVALLLSAPAPLLFGPVVGVAFSLVVVATSMLPDWDIRATHVRHRGLTHTLAFALIVAAILGTLTVASWLALRAAAPTAAPTATTAPTAKAGAVVAAGTFLGVASHLLADALNPGYGTNAMCPFWPVSDRAVRLGIANVDSPAWNWGLLVAGVAAQTLSLSLTLSFG